jgi:hypothetical protein
MTILEAYKAIQADLQAERLREEEQVKNLLTDLNILFGVLDYIKVMRALKDERCRKELILLRRGRPVSKRSTKHLPSTNKS